MFGNRRRIAFWLGLSSPSSLLNTCEFPLYWITLAYFSQLKLAKERQLGMI